MSTFFTQKISYSSRVARVLLCVLVVLTALTGPWWFSFGLASVLILFFRFYEVVLSGILLDTIFAGEGYFLPVGDFLFTSILLCMMSFSMLFMHRLRNIDSL